MVGLFHSIEPLQGSMVHDDRELVSPKLLFKFLYSPIDGQDFPFNDRIVALGLGKLLGQEDVLLLTGVSCVNTASMPTSEVSV